MIGTPYTITNRNGQSIILNDHSNPNRIIALQQYPLFDLDIKNVEVSREGQHGIWDFYSYFGKRTITFGGVIVGETESDVEYVREQLTQVLSLPIQPGVGMDGLVLLSWTDVLGQSWQIECKLDRSIQLSRAIKQSFRLDFTFTLKAADPFIVSQSLITVNGVRGYTQSGSPFPITLPATIGEIDKGAITIPNTGSTFTHTVIRLNGEASGDITNPRILNLTTGAQFKLNTVISGVDEYIEIDSKNGTAVDQDGVDVSGTIDSSSNFVMLAPGNNSLTYLSDEDPQIVLYLPTAMFSVAFRLTKI